VTTRATALEILAALTIVATTATIAVAQINIEELLKGGSQPRGGLGDVRIGEGLKEALRVGTEKTVKLTGRTDGFFKNQAIKILLPERLRALEQGLRTLGFGAKVDELVLGMNRAAERAAPAAKAIFFDAIGQMTIDDARRILSGADTAATQYFRDKTTGKLTTAFTPVVERAMRDVGVSRQYGELLNEARVIPFLRVEDYDLNHYVVGKSLDGLFHVLGDEEKKIRQDPSARVTDLLREVFGGAK
jgi:uncharacterized protein DUF4197